MKTTVMPDRDEMLRRLASVNDDPHNIQKLYPSILAAAGTARTGLGLVMLFQLAMADYTDGMDAPHADLLFRTVSMQVPSWLRALVDDEEVLADALAGFEQVQGDVR